MVVVNSLAKIWNYGLLDAASIKLQLKLAPRFRMSVVEKNELHAHGK